MKKANIHKESELEWIREIPEHWKITRLANFGKFLKGRGITKADLTEEGVPVVLYGDIYTKYNFFTKNFERKTSLENAQKAVEVYENDLLFTASGETKEDIGKCIVYLGNDKAYASGDVIIFKQNTNNPKFLGYVFNSYYINVQKAKLSKGEIVVHVYSSQLRNIHFALPPLEEQTQIANYLDQKTQQIDSLITKKERLIELLEEERTAIINKAVTKGLDPNMPMKDSGIDWMGEIPEHWNPTKLRFLVNIIPSNVDKKTKEGEQEVQLCNYTDVYKNDFIKYDKGFMKASASNAQIEKLTLKKYDVIVTKDSEDPEDIGVPALVMEDLDDVVCGYHLTVLRANNENGFGRFLFWFLKSKFCASYFYTLARGITRYALGTNAFKELSVPTSTKSEEFDLIADFLEEKSNFVQTTIDKTILEIEYLKEYKTTLISEVVTGKIDIREEVLS